MNFEDYVFTSDWAKRKMAEGVAAGKVEGALIAAREALFAVLGARGLTVDDDTCTRIEACRDIATLRHWVTRAAVAESIAAVFA